MRVANDKKRGVTLVEIIVYVGISALLVASLVSFTVAALKTRARVHAQSFVQHDVSTALSFLTREVQLTDEVTIPNEGESKEELAFVSSNAGERAVRVYLDQEALYVDDYFNETKRLTSEMTNVVDFAVSNVSDADQSTSLKILVRVQADALDGADTGEYVYETTITSRE